MTATKKEKMNRKNMKGSWPGCSELYQRNVRHTIISPYLMSSDVNKHHCQVY